MQLGATPRKDRSELQNPDRLRSHLALTREELVEAITHLAFYAGWPSAVTAAGLAREVLQDR